jgi:hypothetical protein
VSAERHVRFVAAAFESLAGARVIHQDLPHDPRGHAVEVRAAGIVRMRLLHQTQIRFVDQGRGLQRVCGASRRR